MALSDAIGDILAQAVLRINSTLDERLNSDAFAKRADEFEEVAHIAGDIIADKIELTPERLLLIRVSALYISTISEARNGQRLVQDSSSILLAEEE